MSEGYNVITMYPNYFQPQSNNPMEEVQQLAVAASARKSDSTRHKCFISYHVADLDEVKIFVDNFGEEFIPVTVGVTDDDDFIDSDNEDYIKGKIREKYLSNSTVTIVLLGAGTYGRKYVDWEISSSLRNDPVNKRNGVLVLTLPSMNGLAKLPERIKDNWTEGDISKSYALYYSTPQLSDKQALREYIEDAFVARTSKSHLVDNSRPLKQRNTN